MAAQVMIVDDEQGIRDVVTRCLSDYGMDVVAARDGRECIEAIKNGFIGILLLDINMPGMNGWDTIREIIKLQYTERVLIILLTTVTSATEAEEELKGYVLDYIPKPADIHNMAVAVKQYLRYFKNQ